MKCLTDRVLVKCEKFTDRRTDRQKTDRRRTTGDQKSSLELSAQVSLKRIIFQKNVFLSAIIFHILHYSTHLKTQSNNSISFDNILFLTLTHGGPKGTFILEKGSLHLLLLTI